MSVLSVCLLETTVYVLVKVGVPPCKGSSQAGFFVVVKMKIRMFYTRIEIDSDIIS